jgi:hydrogenase maturation protease
VENYTEALATVAANREAASLDSFASTHFILGAKAGEFVSLTDPPAALARIAGECQNIGCWPVLVGAPAETDALVASPIILSDYPEVAAESPGDLFDGTEIDEILSLRIMTLTEDEKRQAAATDDRVRAMLARTDALARDQLASLHGTIRSLTPVQPEHRHA